MAKSCDFEVANSAEVAILVRNWQILEKLATFEYIMYIKD